MKNALISFVLSVTTLGCGWTLATLAKPAKGSEPGEQSELIDEIRQLTFAGKRAGEGYFSADGKLLVFQSEREKENPFFQIYLMDRETGDTNRVSPGVGKTTCAWIHPSGRSVLFASTQYDPEAKAKMQAEIDFRNSGETRRYNWDYDETYDLVTFDIASKEYRRLTTETGYDAEGSYSPDGRLICFASNRRAYTDDLSDEERKLFEEDPASAIDLYLMNADGSNVRRLTTSIGYDGGPFFSPDGKRICWRRFDRTGAMAEIMTMKLDGTDQQQLTKLSAMSWAPYYHPSGDYLIFTTNLHGFGNFELYLVAASGEGEPVRVTNREGFDGLPVFTPDGKGLLWTSNGGGASSQLYEASWNDEVARNLLKLDAGAAESTEDSLIAANTLSATTAEFSPADVGRHVDFLCRPELGGRLTGTPGERRATAYVAAFLENLGLKPAGENGTFFQEFEFVSDVELGENNQLVYGDKQYNVDKRWRPVFFSKEGQFAPAEIVFAGYGIVAPEENGQEEYDSYVHLDVTDKWVLVFRQMPQDISPERRQHLARYSGERYKAMVARDRGAKGLIFVSGPNSPLKSRLVPLQLDGSLSGSSLAVLSVVDEVAAEWLKDSGKTLKELQDQLDNGDLMQGFQVGKQRLAAEINVDSVTSRGRNVLARLQTGDKPATSLLAIGAHIDHLGKGNGGGSLARQEEVGGVHRGADDNASGVAAMLEMAQYMASQVESGRLTTEHDILFAAWSGEELGLRGSQAFVDSFADLYPELLAANAHGHGHAMHGHSSDAAHGAVIEETPAAPNDAAHAGLVQEKVSQSHAHAAPLAQSLYPTVIASFNLDMVGRLRDNLILQGIGSSDYWATAIERRNAVVRLPLVLQQDCHLPTDASSFFLAGVPILSAFTGSHSEYHTPRDVPELLNYEGAAQIAKLMALLARDVLTSDQIPQYQEQEAEPQMRANMTAYLGTVPDYGQGDVPGVKLNGATKGAPADKAGIKAGDIIVELAGKKIESIYDYTYAIEALKVGQATTIKVKRGDEVIELDITPGSRN